ncbi:hypothetical protein H7J86_12095 [Mycobacterium hackensackense]|nr:hypothetical protein [Mycobacterium hackensackense]MCV7252907.1 hypothetical protein [Mycobacterium hackensackense]
MMQKLNFARPVAAHRRRIYAVMFVLGVLITGIPFLGVGFGVLPPEPTYTIWGALIYIPLLVPLFTAWWDAPGENRTWSERAAEFTMVWFPVTASSQITWETPWLIGDLTGIMNGAGPDDRWVWLWWGYGAADTRYLTSDAGLYGMEVVAVIGGLALFTAWFYLLRAKATGDDIKRIKGLFVGIVACSMMLAVVSIYYISETRAGFADLEQGFWMGFMFKFVFMNIWWVFAPLITIPFMIKQIDYLYRTLPPSARIHLAPSATAPGSVALKTPV